MYTSYTVASYLYIYIYVMYMLFILTVYIIHGFRKKCKRHFLNYIEF